TIASESVGSVCSEYTQTQVFSASPGSIEVLRLFASIAHSVGGPGWTVCGAFFNEGVLEEKSDERRTEQAHHAGQRRPRVPGTSRRAGLRLLRPTHARAVSIPLWLDAHLSRWLRRDGRG